MDYITSERCDQCGEDSTGLMYHDSFGVPVYFACRSCIPVPYRLAAEDQIDRWLCGGQPTHHGVMDA